MNSENKNEFETNDITKNTEIKSVKNECENTGKIRKYKNKIVDGIKVWYKLCPICRKEQIYSSLKSISLATKNNRKCLSCKNSGIKNPFFGKHHTKEHKNNLSKIQLSTCSYRYKKQGKNPDKIKKNCIKCSNTFYVSMCQNKRKYCSYLCAINDNFGFHPFKKTKPEKKFEEFLRNHNIEYKSPFLLKGKLYDFYIPSKNILVEIDGIYWHGKGLSDKELNETQIHNRKNDNKKTCIARDMGYILHRIWEDEISEETCIKIFI